MSTDKIIEAGRLAVCANCGKQIEQDKYSRWYHGADGAMGGFMAACDMSEEIFAEPELSPLKLWKVTEFAEANRRHRWCIVTASTAQIARCLAGGGKAEEIALPSRGGLVADFCRDTLDGGAVSGIPGPAWSRTHD